MRCCGSNQEKDKVGKLRFCKLDKDALTSYQRQLDTLTFITINIFCKLTLLVELVRVLGKKFLEFLFEHSQSFINLKKCLSIFENS